MGRSEFDLPVKSARRWALVAGLLARLGDLLVRLRGDRRAEDLLGRAGVADHLINLLDLPTSELGSTAFPSFANPKIAGGCSCVISAFSILCVPGLKPVLQGHLDWPLRSSRTSRILSETYFADSLFEGTS